jgi:hypothetical protein
MNVERMALRLALVSVPMFVWLLLYLAKRNDVPFLSNLERPFAILEWITWIPAIILSLLAIVTQNPQFRFGFGLIAVSAGLGIVHRWIRKRCSIDNATPQEDWWPTKKD